MNKTKKNLILSAAIINLINMVANLVIAILYLVDVEKFGQYLEPYIYTISYYSVYVIFVEVIAGIIGSICLFWAIRKGGKYFRRSQGWYYAGVIINIIAGGWIPWILLLISMFIPDIIVMNTPSEIRREEKIVDVEIEQKKRKVEELRRMRDSGQITEEEFNKMLEDLL